MMYFAKSSQNDKGTFPRLMGLDMPIGEDAYGHEDEYLGDMKEIMLDMKAGKVACIFSILGCLIFILPSLAYSQPAGSYLQSCKNSRITDDTLYSSCRDKHRHYHDTSLAQVSRCVGDISNDNGALRCPSYGPIPGGNYQQTCRNNRVQDDTLFSSCLDTHGGYHETSLAQVSQCESSSILNDNGALHCSTAAIPRGTYSESCSRIRIENGTLFGECRKKYSRGTRSASLQDIKSCIVGTDITNVDGYLSCDKGDQPAPGGSYRMTCRDLVMNQGVLSAQCLNYSREFKAASLDIRNCQEPVENNNGQLTCGHVVQQKVPPPPPPQGVSAVEVFNCQTDKNPITVWARGSDQNWTRIGQVSSNCVDNICPNSPGLLVPLVPGPNLILALDPAQCGGQDDPTIFNCEIGPAQPFIGNSSGAVVPFVAGNSASLSCPSP